MNNRMRKMLSSICLSVLSICIWEVGKKQFDYITDMMIYREAQRSVNGNVEVHVRKHNYDWIRITNTSIDYPLMTSKDNYYYLNHNYLGEESISGAIFYNANYPTYEGNNTVIYGHSMRSGTMFNNLHFFTRDHAKFEGSTLTITTKEGSIEYQPLAYYITSDNFYYSQIDDMSTEDAVKFIEENSDYCIKDIDFPEDAHIIVLITCDYSIENGRLIVFYIEK